MTSAAEDAVSSVYGSHDTQPVVPHGHPHVIPRCRTVHIQHLTTTWHAAPTLVPAWHVTTTTMAQRTSQDRGATLMPVSPVLWCTEGNGLYYDVQRTVLWCTEGEWTVLWYTDGHRMKGGEWTVGRQDCAVVCVWLLNAPTGLCLIQSFFNASDGHWLLL